MKDFLSFAHACGFMKRRCLKQNELDQINNLAQLLMNTLRNSKRDGRLLCGTIAQQYEGKAGALLRDLEGHQPL